MKKLIKTTLLVIILLGFGTSAWGDDPEISTVGYVMVYSQDFETENTPDTNYGWNSGDKLTKIRVEDGSNHFYSLKGKYNRSLQFSNTYTRYELTFRWYAKLNSSEDAVQVKFITDHTSTTNKYAFRYNDLSGKMYLSDGAKITNSNKSSYLELTNYSGTTTAPISVSEDFYTVNVVSDGTNVRFTFTNPSGISLSRTFAYSSDLALGGIQVQNATDNGISYIDDIVLTAPVNNWTINYKLGDVIIKSETGPANPGDAINASTIPFTEGGQKYFKYNNEVVTSWTKTGADAETFNVALRLAKSATLRITKNVGGEETVSETTAIEADDNSLPWSYAWSLYEKKSTGVYYKADEDETFIETGTFTDGETIDKTVTYSTADEDVVFFTEVSATEGSGYVRTNAAYSGGTSERFYNGSRSYTIPAEAGCYVLGIKVTGLDGTTNRGATLKVAGTALAEYNIFNVGTHTVPFVMEIENSTLSLTKGYNGTNWIDYIIIRRVSSVSATLGTNGYTTFASAYPLDLTTANMPEGLTAYKAAVSGTTVTFTPLNQTIPANTGILLKGEAGETYNIPVVASGAEVTGNEFLVNTGGTTFTPGDTETYYYFGLKKNTLTFGTFNPSEVAIPASKAYLKVLKSSIDNPTNARLDFVFDDETTGVADVRNKMSFERGGCYNLRGQRVAQPQKGMYIVNGKKVISVL